MFVKSTFFKILYVINKTVIWIKWIIDYITRYIIDYITGFFFFRFGYQLLFYMFSYFVFRMPLILQNFDWLIDYMVFHAVSAVFRPYNGGQNFVLYKSQKGSLWSKRVSLTIYGITLFSNWVRSARNWLKSD